MWTGPRDHGGGKPFATLVRWGPSPPIMPDAQTKEFVMAKVMEIKANIAVGRKEAILLERVGLVEAARKLNQKLSEQEAEANRYESVYGK